MTSESTAVLRQSIYWLIGALAVGSMTARIVGAENVFEPSRYAPLPKDGSFGGERPDKPTRVWPPERPEPAPFYGSNDRSRWATIKTLVDQGTFVIGRRENFQAQNPPFQDHGVIFRSEYQSLDKVMNPDTGEFYSSKPPLLSVLLAGEYWCLKQLCRWDMDRDRWPVAATILITVNVLPFAIFLALLARLLEQHGRTDFGRLVVFMAAAGGTFLSTFGTTLNNHGPAAYCVFFALYPWLRLGKRGPLSYATTGFFAAAAAMLDLPAMAFAAALFVPLLYLRPGRTLLYFLPAFMLPLAAQLGCNYWALGRWLPAYTEFGGPWYNFPGSHWAKLDLVKAGRWVAGIDFAAEPKSVYAFHLSFGHHGWFSLTPLFLLSLGGLLGWAIRCRSDVAAVISRRAREDFLTWPVFGLMTLVVSTIVFGFYVVKTNNYGGNTSGPRWLFWWIPLWLLALLPAADQLARWWCGRWLAKLLLAASVFSAVYPIWNPWRSPWIQQLGERAGWFSYDRPPQP